MMQRIMRIAVRENANGYSTIVWSLSRLGDV
jgi:hypothetical protein